MERCRLIPTKRTKEQLIEAQRVPLRAALGDGAGNVAIGMIDGVGAEDIGDLSRVIGEAWAAVALREFDLRRVDEQGRLLAGGSLLLPWPDEAAPPAITWDAAEHLDDVLAEGTRRVTARARQALEKPAPLPANIAAAVSVLKPGELLVLEVPWWKLDDTARGRLLSGLEATKAPAVLVTSPVKRESVEHLRAALREVGFGVVPLRPAPAQAAASGQRGHGLDGVTCRCSREVPTAEAFATDDGWRCAMCAASEAHDALQKIAHMLDLPAGGDVAKVVPEAVQKALHGFTAEEREALLSGRPLPPQRPHGPGRAAREAHEREAVANRLRMPTGGSITFGPDTGERARSVSEAPCGKCGGPATMTQMGPTMYTLVTDSGFAEAAICRSCISAIGDPSVWTIRAGRIVLKDNPAALTPPSPTFADLLAAGKPALVGVLEQDPNRCARLLEHLLALGGKRGARTTGTDRITFGPVTVWVAHRAEQTMGWPRGFDVAVGFDAHDARRLVYGPMLTIAAEGAPRFWGMA